MPKNITSFSDIEQLLGVEHLKKEDVGLSNTKTYLSHVGNPENNLKEIIHLAGTNGKGSTAASLESILVEHGLKVGLHTSPHLVSYTERYRINKQPIQEKKLISYFDRVYQTTQEKTIFLSLFELMTVAAMHYFSEEKVDVAIFETGLGGRLDATNTLPSKTQIITSISFDHIEFLGNTLEQIATEKAAIIKSESSVFTSNSGSVYEVITQRAKKTHSTLTHVSPETDIQLSLNGTHFKYNNNLYITNLIGAHQAENASLAIAASQSILKKQWDAEKTKMALQKTIWPARLQLARKNPPVFIDGAHNPDGIHKLAKALGDIKIYPKHIYFTAKKSKEIDESLTILESIAPVTLVDVNHFMINTSQIKRAYPHLEMISLEEMNLRVSQNKNEPILITGSLYFIGEVFKSLKASFPFQQELFQ